MITFAEAHTPEEALKAHIINDIYDGEADAEKRINDFAKRLAHIGANRWQVKEHKTKMFREVTDIVNNESISPNVLDKFVLYH